MRKFGYTIFGMGIEWKLSERIDFESHGLSFRAG